MPPSSPPWYLRLTFCFREVIENSGIKIPCRSSDLNNCFACLFKKPNWTFSSKILSDISLPFSSRLGFYFVSSGSLPEKSAKGVIHYWRFSTVSLMEFNYFRETDGFPFWRKMMMKDQETQVTSSQASKLRKLCRPTDQRSYYRSYHIDSCFYLILYSDIFF